MDRYKGRAALVTGAASGIGEAVGRRLVSLGMIVYGCDRDESGLARITKDIQNATEKSVDASVDQSASIKDPVGENLTVEQRFIPMVCDLRKEDEIQNMFSEIKEKSGYVAVCVLSAGVGHKAPLLTGESSMFRSMFEVNVLGTILCVQGCFKLMQESKFKDGHIVLINSLAGHSVRVGQPDYADFNFYNATKYAMTAITEGIRYELRLNKSKVRVTQISPGLVETNFTHSMYPDEGHIIDMLYESTVTLKKEDVADAVIHVLERPAHVQIHDVRISANGPDRPADWGKNVAAAKAKVSE